MRFWKILLTALVFSVAVAHAEDSSDSESDEEDRILSCLREGSDWNVCFAVGIAQADDSQDTVEEAPEGSVPLATLDPEDGTIVIRGYDSEGRFTTVIPAPRWGVYSVWADSPYDLINNYYGRVGYDDNPS